MNNLLTTIFGISLALGQLKTIQNHYPDIANVLNVVGAAGVGIAAKDARNRL